MDTFDTPLTPGPGALDVLTLGELLVDMMATSLDASDGGDHYQRFFGGSPANIAMNVRHLGFRSALACSVGRDPLGDFLVRYLAADGLDTPLVQRSGASTSMVVVNRTLGTPVPIFYRGADYQLSITPELESAIRSTRILHFSSWPLSRKPARDTVERALDIARESGIRVGLDPNYHPALWDPEEDGVAVVRRLAGRAWVVKPSEVDAERLFGPDTPERQVRRFHDLGVQRVVMTLGKDGVLASDGHMMAHFDSLATEITDVTGAGDAFWSGLYAGMLNGGSLRQAIHTGLAVSAVKLRKVGAVVGLPPLADVMAQFPASPIRQENGRS